MAEDRLRDLIDLVLGSLDEPGADGRALAARAHFSRDHLDRLLAAATGESPVALRRRLLLERAAWQLRVAGESPSAVAPAAGYGSLAAFSRAFARAYGISPRAFADAAEPPIALPAPNGIRFHPPAGLLIPTEGRMGGRDVTERLLVHHLARTRELLTAAAKLTPAQLAQPLRPGFVAVPLEGAEADAATMARRLVTAIEVWVAAMAGLRWRRRRPTATTRTMTRPRCCAGSIGSGRRSRSSCARSPPAARGTTPSSTRSASRRRCSPTAASSRTC